MASSNISDYRTQVNEEYWYCVSLLLNNSHSTLIDTSDFEWIIKHYWRAEFKKKSLYVSRRTTVEKKNKKISLHREIIKAPHGMFVDHINHDTLDNRSRNLRLCTRSQNMMNTKIRSGFSSKYKGAHWDKNMKKWCVCLNIIPNKTSHVGYFSCEKTAALVYNEKALKYFGEFAHINTIE